jgi:HNH endonuclease
VPVSAGRRSRTIPGALRRALRARDGGCRFPGCTHERFVDAHHIEHWADGGETAVDNLVQLCRRHHRLIHEGRFRVARRSDGEVEFRDRSGAVLRQRPAATQGDATTITTGRRNAPRQPSGDRLDLDLTVDCMIQRAAHGRPERVSENVFSDPPPSIAIVSPVT